MRASGNLQWNDEYPNMPVVRNDKQFRQLWVADVEAGIAGFAAITTDQEPEYAPETSPETVAGAGSKQISVTARIRERPSIGGYTRGDLEAFTSGSAPTGDCVRAWSTRAGRTPNEELGSACQQHLPSLIENEGSCQTEEASVLVQEELVQEVPPAQPESVLGNCLAHSA